MSVKLKNEQWKRIYEFLKKHPNVYAGNERDSRKFVEAVLWIMRSGSAWRLLPEKKGKWNSVYKRMARWGDKNVWEAMFAYFADDPDMQSVMIDSTVVRAHPCSAGASHEKGGQDEQALGRSAGGFSTKIHLLVDALGYPLRIILTKGQAGDAPQAPVLLKNILTEQVLADKAYDTNTILDLIRDHLNAEVVIPPKANRTEPHDYDKDVYKERHLIECFIGKIKHFRRIFTRYDKLAKRYRDFLCFVSTLIWLR